MTINNTKISINFLKSKRFFFTMLALVIWVVMLLITSYSPIEVASGLSILLAPYLAAESWKKSDSTVKTIVDKPNEEIG